MAERHRRPYPREVPRQKPASNASNVLGFERRRGTLRHVARVERRGLEVVLTRGKLGDDGRVTRSTARTTAEAKAHAEELVQKLLAEGFAPVAGPPGSTAIRGRVAHDPGLEQLIEEAPDDPARSLVYADWLTEQGDVRGELIRVQLALEERPDDLTLLRTEGVLLKDFAAELLGPLARLTVLRRGDYVLPGVRWRRGFLRAVRLWFDPGEQGVARLLRWLFGHPSGRFVERVVLACEGFDEELAVLRELAPRTLAAIEVHVGSTPPGDVSGFLELPGLRQLVVVNQPFSFGDVTQTRLEELLFDVGHTPPSDVLVAMSRMAFPALRHLSVPAGLLPILPDVFARAPQLRQLTLQGFRSDDMRRFFALDVDGRLDELHLDDECRIEAAVQHAAALSKPPILIAHVDPKRQPIPPALRARLQPPWTLDALDRPMPGAVG
jgi:uncharacterized protein (TIGR02996 family)